ncbi:MAG: Adenylate cyclase [Chloroflexi bacterium AL-W]|nr:Adenylate cyclase [Chloroflexi bacterium AL-N1]NOK64534.1 Adenylate cyclase [Chloroflexi bacterium AL-N10]NOK75776.1 Adenylate cyclase [Chloroflexi bacterium AL-N5]NOK80465.1 Adenylate cyclase [Chloroflexi bacterium AL-W]NOK86979.1 Adenylate cyclase [Chloroflexi bacterium AL-N15]
MLQLTILIVDDTCEHRDILRRLLQSEGYRVVEAQPGLDALQKSRSMRPDLILASLSLPGHPAWDTIQQLRAQPTLSQTPILGTTVYETLLSRARIRSVGCVDCVEKPFDFDYLLSSIDHLLLTSSSLPPVA